MQRLPTFGHVDPARRPWALRLSWHQPHRLRMGGCNVQVGGWPAGAILHHAAGVHALVARPLPTTTGSRVHRLFGAPCACAHA